MAIQMRRGNYADFDASKMVAGEFAVCLDNGYVYVTLSPGNVVKLGTADTIEDALTQALAYTNQAKGYAESASTSATSATSANTSAKNYKEDAEAYAIGKRGGASVATSDPTYHNNSKYYSEQAQYFSEHATYVYIRYSANADGTNFVATPTSNTVYLGVYSGSSATAPTDKTAYSWVRFIGRDGSGTNSISTLTDVALGALSNGQTLVYNSSTQKWENRYNKASKTSLGGIIVGNNLDIDDNGVLSAASEALTPATDSNLGGIIVGDNLQINASGKLDAINTTYTIATTDVAGLMSASDKEKLNGIAEGATANVGTITGVLGDTNNIGVSTNTGTVTVSHKYSGVGSGYYGDSGSSRTLSAGGSFTVPYFNVNSWGHITYATSKTITIPSSYSIPNASATSSGGIKVKVYSLTPTKNITVSAHSAANLYFLDFSTASSRNLEEYSPYKMATNNGGTTLLGAIISSAFTYEELFITYDSGYATTKARIYNASTSSVTLTSGVSLANVTVFYI